VAAVNQEFAYLRDRQGRLHVFDARRPTDPNTRRSAPLAGIELGEFNVPVTNMATDRVYLAADNGLIVCLRDAAAKYARPVRMSPEIAVNPLPKEAPKKDGMPPMAPETPPAPDTPPAPAPEPKKPAPVPKKPGD